MPSRLSSRSDDVAVVADDQVDAVQLGLGEFDSRVDDDHIVAELDERRVLADLTHAAQRADADVADVLAMTCS